MNKLLCGLILLTALSIAACSSMPATKIYTLNIPAEEQPKVQGDATVVITVDAERYLQQPYIAYRNSPYELEISKYSKWASAPGRILGNELQAVLSSAGLFKDVKLARVRHKGNYLIKIDLKNFERSGDKNSPVGVLVFDIGFISPDGKELFSTTVSKKEKLGSSSFSALAEGLSRSLGQSLAEVKEDIADALRNEGK
ncbi:MAG: membrane integrity-associated transporter subunit PqiC [Nitrospirae bacterium]|nr:membrane integrity-associated transporter subunit PqiC [Nitrospirota bacterium]